MARDDTRLHRLEAMVAGLLAWQNVAEKSLAELEQRLCSGQPGCDLWAGGPEPAAAPTQAACPACGAVGEGAVWVVPTYAADWEHRMMDVMECRACHHRWTSPKQAAQPAPQQPRSCKTCRFGKGALQNECIHCSPMEGLQHQHWQPRSGGG